MQPLRFPPTSTLLIVVLAMMVVAAPFGLTGVRSVSPAPPSPGHPATSAAAKGLPVRHAGLHPGGASALASTSWYTQVGATLTQLNGSTSLGGLKSLGERFTLVTSAYPVGYELNGLSNSGDWYQIVVADNWPGCSLGFEEVTEVWDNTGASGPVNCDPTVSLSSGDTLALAINYTSAGNTCLDLTDLTTASFHAVCQAQPDSGATSFVVVSGSANSNGYFTGPMTEVVNLTASSCPDYKFMPKLSYVWPSSEWITQYTPWSDEWEYGGSYTYCYGGTPGATTLSAGDPRTNYDDTASGTSYGPHWVAGQNYSQVVAGVGWRLQTDPTPLTGVSINADRTSVRPGTIVNLTAVVAGGLGPYSALWFLNGTRQTATTTSWGWTAGPPATYHFTAYGVDANKDVIGLSNVVAVTVQGPLSVSSIAATPNPSGADVGEYVTFAVIASGGIAPRTFVWTGLPLGCASANVSLLACSPTQSGSNSIVVSVTDSNRTVVHTPPLSYLVSSAPTVALASSATALDANQSLNLSAMVAGGAGTFTYTWFGTPRGCPGANAALLQCSPRTAETTLVHVTAVDGNGMSVNSSTLTITIYPAPDISLRVDKPFVDDGQMIRWTGTATGGPGPFTFNWSGLPTGCTSANLSLLSCAAVGTGTVAVTLSAVDPFGVRVTSAPVATAIYPALSVALTVSPTAVATGDVVSFSATIGGGDGPIVVNWTGVPGSCYAPAAASFTCQLQETGTFNVTVVVSDATGSQAKSSQTLTVRTTAPAPALTSAELLGLGLVAVVAIAIGVLAARRKPRPPRAP